MKKVLLRGPALSKSGYGEHTRQVFRYLDGLNEVDLTVQILPWGITPWYLNHDACDGIIGKIMQKSNFEANKKFDVTVQVQLPNEWDHTLGKTNIGITACVETDICNPRWVGVDCERMDHVVVPSMHAKNSIVNSGKTKTPIDVIGETYFDELLEDSTDFELELKTDFNLLTVGVLTGITPNTDRKNLFYLIKWFVEEFKNDENVGLVIKTCHGRDNTLDRASTESMLKSLLKEIDHQGKPKIYLIHGEMQRREMNSLYKHPKIKGLVSMTRGEGFGLPLLEAAVAGLPVIATNWSAHTEFLDYGSWIKLDYELKKVDSTKVDNNIFMPNAKWAEVKEQDFKSKLRKFYNTHTSFRPKAAELGQKLASAYSWDSISKQYEEKIGSYFR